MKATVDTGTSLYYEIAGEGAPLILLHGTGCDHRFWAMQVEHYARTHTVVAVDMRGGGQSDIPVDVASYSSAVMADDVAGLIRQLRLGPAHVSGHSLGSCVAQQLALRHPQTVSSLQLHATWAYADTWLQRAFIGTTRYPLENGDHHQVFRTVMMWMLSPSYLSTRKPDHVATMVRHCFIDNPHLQANEGMLGHLEADTTHDTRDALHTISTPTLVTAGEDDYLIPARYGEEVHSLVPGSTYHLFRGQGSTHAMNWEQVETFNDVTSTFLAGLA
jgi:pimeloyl-ACP methyl ester carboxylesterase